MRHYYVIKDGRTVSEYNNRKEAEKHVREIDGDMAVSIDKTPPVSDVTLTIDDLKILEKHLMNECGLDSLDIVELVTLIEDIKDIRLDV